MADSPKIEAPQPLRAPADLMLHWLASGVTFSQSFGIAGKAKDTGRRHFG
jgi:hypothetical protein